MIRILLISIIGLLFLNGYSYEIVEQPKPPRLVNDFHGLLKANELSELEQKLVKFDDSSSSQIAVVIIGSTNGYPISNYAFELGEKWGVGQADFDNGIVCLFAMKDRDVFIATGYGLEDVVPDALAKRIIQNIVIPNFKSGNYYSGINEACDALIALSEGRYEAVPEEMPKPNIPVIFFIIFFIIIVIILSNLFDGNNHTYTKRGHYPSGRTWSGSSWGKGGSFGGGGGFGGFGGGSFGGGGAGGSW